MSGRFRMFLSLSKISEFVRAFSQACRISGNVVEFVGFAFFVFLVWPFPNTEPSTEIRTGRERPRRIQRETSTEHRVTICASGGSSPPGTIDSVSAARSYLHPGTWRRAQTQSATKSDGDFMWAQLKGSNIGYHLCVHQPTEIM